MGQIVKSLYDSFNSLLTPYGLSIPRVLVGATVLLGFLVLWGIINGIRNRKSFTLIDEEEGDGNVSQIGGGMGGGVLRPESGSEGA